MRPVAQRAYAAFLRLPNSSCGGGRADQLSLARLNNICAGSPP